jgi:hypothetical protein
MSLSGVKTCQQDCFPIKEVIQLGNILELTVRLRWVAIDLGLKLEEHISGEKGDRTFSNEVIAWKHKKVVAYLADEDEKPVLYINGKQAALNDFHSVTAFSGRKQVFQDGLADFLRIVWLRGEVELDMTFTVQGPTVPEHGQWWNASINVAFEDLSGMEYDTTLAPFAVCDNSNYLAVNGPQWRIKEEHETSFIPIITGRLAESLKGLVEATFREQAPPQRMLPIPMHNGWCTLCSWFRSDGYERDGCQDNEGITYSCALGKFKSFNSNDITTELRERCFVTEDWKSMDADANWAWVTPEDQEADRVLSLQDWLSIGQLIDNDEHPHHVGYEYRFSNFERLYDDMIWLERVAKNGFEPAMDLDAEIIRLRNVAIRKAARIWARKLPEYANLFLQVATGMPDERLHKIVPEEVGEKPHKVPISRFISKEILKPCGLGQQWKHSEEKGLVCYRFQGYDLNPDQLDVFKMFVDRVTDEE